MPHSVFTAMNERGSRQEPFLFIIDFEIKKPVLVSLADREEGFLYKMGGGTGYRQVLAGGADKHGDILVDMDGGKDAPQDSPAVRIMKSGKDAPQDSPASRILKFDRKPVSFATYKKAFEDVVKNINYGNSFLVNLTFPTEIETNHSLLDIYHQSRAKYKICYKDEFVVFSPETFVDIKEGTIYSHPMKGTIDAAIPDAERIILEDPKEQAEHATITDLIRNDLSRVAMDVKVEQYRYLELLKTNQKNLLQVSSRISGQLPPNYHERIGDIFRELLPAGSISGAPKPKTVDIIRGAEGQERGYFTGVFGIFDGTNVKSAVMIRYIEKKGNRLFFRSGGGITSNSEVRKEYEEMINKVYVPVY